jgi:tripartite-type tricarboxylate transporter receptor subunit TctC
MKVKHAGVAVLLMSGLCGAPALAQSYPAKTLRIVVPFPAGGGVDATARIVGQKLSEQVGQPVIIDNRAGAAGTIGADFVAKSAPDGYTLLVAGPGAISVASLVFSKLPYVPARDLAPVTMLVTMPYIAVAHPSVPARDAAQLIALARANPGKLNMASGGTGTGQHLAGELFKQMAKINMLHISYKGTAPALADLMGGHADVAFLDPTVLPQIASGKLRAIGVSGARRYGPLASAPVIAESGLPGYDAINWYPLMAPAGVPAALINRLNQEAHKAMADTRVRERLTTQGLIPAPGTPEQLGVFIREDTRRWEPVIKAIGLRMD